MVQLRRFIGTGIIEPLTKDRVRAIKKVYQAILNAKEYPVSMKNIRYRTKQKHYTIRDAIVMLAHTVPAECPEGTKPLIKYERQQGKKKKFVFYYKIWPIEQGGYDDGE